MSGYRSGHEQGHNPYIDYAPHSDSNPDERVYVSHVPDTRHSGPQGLHPIDESHLGGHHRHHPSQESRRQSHVVYGEHEISHQPPQYSGGSGMMYGTRQMQPPPGTKRSRPDDLELEMGSVSGQSMHQGSMQSIQPHMSQPPMVYGSQTVQAYHTHPLPNQAHRSKIPRLNDDESVAGPSAPSVVGMEGMPSPAQKPRGPKLKFTPEDDALLVDLKENKSLTWKQIADFFPGRSSGTLQVRYCTKLKAKTTQWSDETIQKLRNALHEYEQEKWRIVAQKVGNGFTSAACKEKAAEL
ncbi:hypothetical protein K3495_g5884 [Podosphaera aphanis]|nr:hypothetical protein K3495_g5884 [Podosphaera aphanis]